MAKTLNSTKVYIKLRKSGETVFLEKAKISAKQFRQLSQREVVVAEKVSTNCGTKAKPNTRSGDDSDSESESKPKNKSFLNLRSKSLVRKMKNKKKTTKRGKRIEDHYKNLGIRRYASPEEIKRAYLGLAKRHHPDRHSSDGPIVRQRHENLFKSVANSYGLLIDDTERQVYNQWLSQKEDILKCINNKLWPHFTQNINTSYNLRNHNNI